MKRVYRHKPLYKKKYYYPYRDECRQIIRTIKEKGCCICGYNKCASAMDFHHPNKRKSADHISEMVSGVNTKVKFKRVLSEIEKCILICANCHREIHSELGDLRSNERHNLVEEISPQLNLPIYKS